MRLINTTSYGCEICGEEFKTEAEALECEKQPVTQSKGVKVGEIINIITGQGIGRGEVTTVYIIQKSWGHYAWKRYWHTEAITAKCLNSYGERVLTFDDYNAL